MLQQTPGQSERGPVGIPNHKGMNYPTAANPSEYHYPGQSEAIAREFKAQAYPNGGPVGPPDHLSLLGMINLTVTDARQLFEEIQELRSRLTPLLAEREAPRKTRPMAPVITSAAAELQEAHRLIENARELVYLTLAQLDI